MMKLSYHFTLLLFSPILLWSQIHSVVIDKETGNRIPYVNIWVEDLDRGVSSNALGEFSLQVDSCHQMIVFSAIGYAKRGIKSSSINEKVLLTPIAHEIQEVRVTPSEEKELRVNGFRKSKINHYFMCDTLPWIYARYFEYKQEYNETQYLKSIRVLCQNRIRSAKFNVILYKNDNGAPGEYLHNQNIIVTAPKGNRFLEIDFSKKYIEFPKEGFFVAIEWLAIPENKLIEVLKSGETGKKIKRTSHQPLFGLQIKNIPQNDWYFIQGQWKRIWKDQGTNDIYQVVAIELVLGN